jgi:hypothetical protein
LTVNVSQVTLGGLVKWLAGSGPERQRPPVAGHPLGRLAVLELSA